MQEAYSHLWRASSALFGEGSGCTQLARDVLVTGGPPVRGTMKAKLTRSQSHSKVARSSYRLSNASSSPHRQARKQGSTRVQPQRHSPNSRWGSARLRKLRRQAGPNTLSFQSIGQDTPHKLRSITTLHRLGMLRQPLFTAACRCWTGGESENFGPLTRRTAAQVLSVRTMMGRNSKAIVETKAWVPSHCYPPLIGAEFNQYCP